MLRVNLLHNESDLLRRAYYRPWTFKAWSDGTSTGVKLGPVSLFGYRWIDQRIRVSMTTAWSPNERILWGGPLAS